MTEVTSLLGNAQRNAREHPDTFWAPDKAMLKGIAVGNFVKVCDEANAERFWTTVIDKQGEKITASVANNTIRWSLGTVVKYHQRCAYQVATEAEMQKYATGLALEAEGMLEPPSPAQQEACMVGTAVAAHGDIFDTGSSAPMSTPVAPETVLAWYKADADRLQGTGLTADDLGVFPLLNVEELMTVCGAPYDQAVRLVNVPFNLVLAPALVAEHFMTMALTRVCCTSGHVIHPPTRVGS